MVSDRNSALEIVKKVLLADFAGEPGDLDAAGVAVREFREADGARRFPVPGKYLAAVTMGAGVIVCASAGRLPWARENLAGLDRDTVFGVGAITRMQEYVSADGQEMYLQMKYVCTRDTFTPYGPGGDIELKTVEKERLAPLYRDNLFPNALGRADNPDRPHTAAVVAVCDNRIVGVAAATADCDPMWQAGVDTLPGYRRRGIAKATVSALTELVLSKNILPYYSARLSNIASRRTAVSLGYRPAWVDIYSFDKQT
jgi:GNAT superfamily N-acetyltransferase